MTSRPNTFGEIVAAELNSDPEFRAEWQRLAPARALAAAVLRYRVDHGLSQRALAAQLGVSQPRVAKLESGEHNPDVDTLIHLARSIGIEFCVDVAPETRKQQLVTKKAKDAATVSHDRVNVTAAAS